MRLLRILILLLCFGWILPIQAQDELTPYEIALQRIEEARVTGATELDLAYLDLTELPSELWQLLNLEDLWLQSNSLRNLPPEIGELANLQRLSLDYNHLTSLPAEIGQLRNLRLLSLYLNQLHSLPPEIGQLTNLEELKLNRNQLISLPAEIGQLSHLCIFELFNNNISHLPNSVGNLMGLTEPDCNLNLDRNPLISPPPEVIAQGTPAILEYLRNQAWWYLRRMIIYTASGIGFLAIVFLGLRWRYRRQYTKKKKRL
jgi:Leucine-rich repeat (LRR) protein